MNAIRNFIGGVVNVGRRVLGKEPIVTINTAAVVAAGIYREVTAEVELTAATGVAVVVWAVLTVLARHFVTPTGQVPS